DVHHVRHVAAGNGRDLDAAHADEQLGVADLVDRLAEENARAGEAQGNREHDGDSITVFSRLHVPSSRIRGLYGRAAARRRATRPSYAQGGGGFTPTAASASRVAASSASAIRRSASSSAIRSGIGKD